MTDALRIYEASSITVKGEVAAKHAELVEEVTFKFFVDGKASEEKVVAMKTGTKDARSGNVVVTHTLRAPPVPDDKDAVTLDYHVFYKVKQEDGTTEMQQSLAVRKFQVLPRTAQLAVTHVKDGKPVPDFQFKVFQGGQQFGGIQSTFAAATANAKGETIPAGTAEFNLGLVPGFRIVQASPYEIAEETVASGRKRAAKGEPKFRAVFVAPTRGTHKQYVNLDLTDEGTTGLGREVTIAVAPEGDEDRAVKIASERTEVHFRVTFGPESGEVTKSKRDDAERPTKVTGDATVTIEEKSPKTKYQGKVTLGGGTGYFKVHLGAAGGDTCLVEIAGSDKFLTDTTVGPDQTLTFENWRRLYYEVMVPDVMSGRVISADGALSGSALKKLESVGRQLFVELVPDGATVFDVTAFADRGTLLRTSFVGLPGRPDDVSYVLSGRNWRDLPDGQGWLDEHPSRTLFLMPCDALLKWRKDTAEPQAATKDYSGVQKAVAGSLDMEATFGGLFMPFSGDDGGDGIVDITWTADIAATDACCKYTPALEVEAVRKVPREDPQRYEVYAAVADPTFPAGMLSVVFEKSGEKLDPTLGPEVEDAVQDFVHQILPQYGRLALQDGQVKVLLGGPADGGQGEDACFAAVEKKLVEVFDASKAEFAWHPGLDPDEKPRTGRVTLAEISDEARSTTKVWHYRLNELQADGSIGPGLLVGAEKSKSHCPITLELSAQPHVAETGGVDGRKVVWVADPTKGPTHLVRYVLGALSSIKDKAALKHGHGAEGRAGDCLATAEVPCADCIGFGRSVSLESLG